MSDFYLKVVYIGERRICIDDNGITQLYWDRNVQAISVTSEKYGHYCKAIAKNILNNEDDAHDHAKKRGGGEIVLVLDERKITVISELV